MNTTLINQNIRQQREALLNHPLYEAIQSVDDLKIFLEGHVFAVWDFMSLLKALQINLTCTTTPWIPVGNPQIRYLINEIVLAEETDVDKEGNRFSHYELYIEAMEDLGADTSVVKRFIASLAENTVFEAIDRLEVHANVKAFLWFTFEVIQNGKPHEIAAAFTFGREDLIPDMFTSILRNFQVNFPEAGLEKLVYYFERHIELDGDEHGPMAMKMIEELCGSDSKKWEELNTVSIAALEKRIGLWDGIYEQVLAAERQHSNT